MEYRILGPVEARTEHGPVALGGVKPRAVLAVLLLHANEPVSADRLAQALWGEDAPAGAVRTVQVHVSRLRKALGNGGIVETTSAGYCLRVRPGELDAERFAQLVEDGRRSLAAGEPDRAAAVLRQALTLWRGTPLAELGFEPFAQTEIARLEEQRLAAIEARVGADLAAGRDAELVGELQQLVAAHPTRERLACQLMLAFYRGGRQAEALEAYHDARRVLVAEIGVEPGPELRDLHEAILHHDPALRAGVSNAEVAAERPIDGLPPRLRHAARARFVGRASERQRFVEAWRAAQTSGPGVVTLAGEPGIGKTCLTAHLADAVHDGGATVLYGRCEQDVGAPYQPWVDILGEYVDRAPQPLIERHVQRYGTVLARLAPRLVARATGVSAAPTNDPEAERYLLFGAVLHLMLEATKARPVLLVLDDLHWADRPTLLLLRHLATSGEPMRMLVVAAYRDTDADESLRGVLADLRRDPGAERLTLEGLTLPDVVGLFEASAGRELTAPEHALAGELTSETSGNPFFLVQLLRHLVESGAIVEGPAGWQLAQAVRPTELPETVRDVIARRVGRLGDEAVRLLQIAAVAGREFDLDVLTRVGERSEDDVLEFLGRAAHARLVVEVSSGRFAFVHALVNHALVAELGPTRRERLHARIAEALEALRGDERLGDVAYHWLAARADRTRAVVAARNAGRWALDQLAPDEAARWFREGLALLEPDAPGDCARRCDLLIGLGEAQRHAGDAGYRRTLLDASALAREIADDDLLARAALANSRGFESASGAVDPERVAALEAALARLEDRADPRRARLVAQLQLEQTFVTDLAERRRLSDDAVALAERDDDPSTLAHVLWARHAVLWTPDLLGEHQANAARLEAVAAGLDDPVTSFWAHCDVVLTSMWAADIDRVDRGLATMQEIADRVGQPILRWIRLWYGSWRAYVAGRLDEAAALAVEAAVVGVASGQPDAEAFRADQLMPITWDRGGLGDAIPLLEGAVAANPGLPVFSAWLALAYCEQQRPDDARRVLAVAAADDFRDVPWDIVWLPTVCLYAEVCTRLRARREAAVLGELLAPYADLVAFNASSVLGSVAGFLGGLGATGGDWRAADAHFAHAAAVHERLGAPGLLARTHCGWGLALQEADLHDRASELLERACAAAEQLGMSAIPKRVALAAEVS
jgi:DNA-binding SARP family transcriptional activator